MVVARIKLVAEAHLLFAWILVDSSRNTKGVSNMFNLFGFGINMIVLLLVGFAVLNAISLLYEASLAACVSFSTSATY